MTSRFAHAHHPKVTLGQPLTTGQGELINGREPTVYEAGILSRARAAALVAETNALFSGLVITENIQE